jgi:hypothetical protein
MKSFAGRQIVEDKSIEHEVDEQKISNIMTKTSGSGAPNFFNQDLFAGVSADRDVAPGINADLLQVSLTIIELVLIDQQSMGKRSLHLMDTVNAKKRWTTVYLRVNIFYTELHSDPPC